MGQIYFEYVASSEWMPYITHICMHTQIVSSVGDSVDAGEVITALNRIEMKSCVDKGNQRILFGMKISKYSS